MNMTATETISASIIRIGLCGWVGGGYHSYHLDAQNGTMYITDAGQMVENSYQYDAFGVIRGREETIHNRILYTGQQYDQVTGQYYLRARYHNPSVGDSSKKIHTVEMD